MGTRADFYVGRGREAEWLGSIAWDGYPDGIDKSVLEASTEDEYRKALASFAAERDDWTDPSKGWPWPWDDSRTTDFAYAFDGGIVFTSPFGRRYVNVLDYLDFDEDEADAYYEEDKEETFPNMRDCKNVAWGKRSGIMIIGSEGVIQPDD